jgi:hypothetical protein
MRGWLARLSFALLVLAFVLAWEAYRAATGRAPGGSGRVVLLAVGAALLFGMGIKGVRERHRSRGE